MHYLKAGKYCHTNSNFPQEGGRVEHHSEPETEVEVWRSLVPSTFFIEND